MKIDWVAARRRLSQPQVLGALAVLTIASVVYSQFNIYGKFSRDSAIYVYGGQRLTHGVPPYASEMDPKGPIPSILCGFGVAVARLLGRSDVLIVRIEFCALAILSVLGLYLLVLELWHSVIAAVVASAVFVWFRCYAHQALIGPEGHEPGIVFLIFALWLSVRRQWFLAGIAASLAFTSWQPLFAYPVFVAICAVVWSAGHRLRSLGWALAGIATPFVALIVYYAAEGYPRSLFEGLFLFPITGVRRPPYHFGWHLMFIFRNIANSYMSSSVFLWIGLVLLLFAAGWTVVSARSERRKALLSPLVLLIVGTFVLQVAYVVYDYIGWTHAFPLLPYAAIGFGAVTALSLERLAQPRARRITVAALSAAVAVGSIIYAVVYYEPTDPTPLRSEQATACAIKQTMVPHTPLWALGNPIPLVLLHIPNPDNYPYEGSGLDVWRVEHTAGGFHGWVHQIKASGASVVVEDAWRGPYRARMRRWLSGHGYHDHGYIGAYRVYLTRAALRRMRAHSIVLTRDRGLWPTLTHGDTYRVTHCTGIAAG